MTQPLMALTARLDVNQVDDGIDWIFSDIDSIGSADRTATDPHWNRDIVFSAGQEFRIAIAASDQDKTGFESLEVIDCCVITRPQILCCGKGVRTNYAPPSLFVDSDGKQLGALYKIDPSAFSVHGTGIDPTKGRKVTLLWDGNLKVGPYNGFWEISFYVTLGIKRVGEDKIQLRVFYFDPEGEVGNGSEPPN
ncbi:hypothetical protein ABIB38_002186 [Massilia sp. UYP11]|uniref:hypothetical protein n=1 Tax=Massilia sp. UYP11 TaxID=1756385 RepID=UPI003D24DC97